MTIRLQDVRTSRGGKLVLDVPALTLAGDGVTAILGPNGSGKSTLLRTIAGLDDPGGGRVSVGEARERPRVSVAFQSAVFVHGSVRRNIALALALRGVRPGQRRERITRAAAFLGVEALLDRDARSLSGGEAQRANLARALAVPADVVLLDEPLAGVDDPTAQDLLALLPAALAALGCPVVVVTHERDEALRLAQRAVILLGGRVADEGPLPSLFRSPRTPEVAALLGYTLFPQGTGLLAVGPGELRQGEGDGHRFTLLVEQVHDLTYRREAVGRVGDVRAAAWVERGVSAGDRIPVVARRDRCVQFPSP